MVGVIFSRGHFLTIAMLITQTSMVGGNFLHNRPISMVKMRISLQRGTVPSISIKQPRSGCFMRHTSRSDLASVNKHNEIYN